SLLERLGEGGRSSLLESPEGARRAGNRIRGRTTAGEPAQARPGRGAERPAAVPRDPVRGREHLPRGVEGHGREDPRRQAVRRPRAEAYRPGCRIASRAVAEETGELAAEHLRKLLAVTDADTAAFLLLDDTGEELVARAAKGLEEEVDAGARIPVGGGFAGRIAAERAPVVIEDVDHAEVLIPMLREKGVKSLLGVPLT